MVKGTIFSFSNAPKRIKTRRCGLPLVTFPFSVCVFMYNVHVLCLYRILVLEIYKVVGVVKWHWEREAWQRQTSVRKRLTFPLPPPPEGEEWITAGEEATDDSAEHGDMETDDGRPESIPMEGSTDKGNSSSSSGSSIESRVNGIRA